jgi:hypothetical protein
MACEPQRQRAATLYGDATRALISLNTALVALYVLDPLESARPFFHLARNPRADQRLRPYPDEHGCCSAKAGLGLQFSASPESF